MKVTVKPVGRNEIKFRIDEVYLEKLLAVLMKMESEE